MLLNQCWCWDILYLFSDTQSETSESTESDIDEYLNSLHPSFTSLSEKNKRRKEKTRKTYTRLLQQPCAIPSMPHMAMPCTPWAGHMDQRSMMPYNFAYPYSYMPPVPCLPATTVNGAVQKNPHHTDDSSDDNEESGMYMYSRCKYLFKYGKFYLLCHIRMIRTLIITHLCLMS
jgi:hypothetical protein